MLLKPGERFEAILASCIGNGLSSKQVGSQASRQVTWQLS